MSERRNPWDAGVMLGALVLLALGALFILGLLVGVLIGWIPTKPGGQVFAGVALGVIAGMLFIFHMSSRWNKRHPKQGVQS